MVSLLILHGILSLLAIGRGWRIAPVALTALPWLLVPLEPLFPPLAFAGWILPFANLLIAAGVVSTLGLLYTAVAEPESA